MALAASASLLAAAEGLKEKGLEAASLFGVCTFESTPESGVVTPSAVLSDCAAGFDEDSVESLLPSIPPRPPNEKLPASALALEAGCSSLPFVSLSSAALLAAKAEKVP